MSRPTIIVGCGSGYHNEDLEKARERLKNAKVYSDLSTTILVATRGMIPAQVVQSWQFLATPPNSAVGRAFASGFEVGDAYNTGIETLLRDPGLGRFKYILTMEDDNLPPHDGLVRLCEDICHCDTPCKEHFTAVGGLYWTKGDEGIPMIYGDPNERPLGFKPQLPEIDTVQECNGVGMGFTLFHAGLFRDPALYELYEAEGESFRRWFVTSQQRVEEGFKVYTQDLWFFENMRKAGYRVACDTAVKVGHLDIETEMVW